MNSPPTSIATGHSRRRGRAMLLWALLGAAFVPQSARASMFHGETLDSIANGISWAVLVIAPIIGIAIFWLVHILPEKIAHKRKHPQTRLVQCLCLMSLVFGGILWPLAWILAYSKPVLHKLAYGTDVDESLAHDDHGDHGDDGDHGDHAEANAEETGEVEKLRARIGELERQITGGNA
jgi:CBS domain containing-hemolysin-like protein